MIEYKGETMIRSVYLAHPFAKKDEGVRIQRELEALGLEVINPFERGEQAIYNVKLAPGGGGLDAQDCADIVKMDLEKIDQTDAVVALLIDSASVGTIMEIFYAGHVVKHPIFSLAPTPRYAEHPWIRFYTTVYQTEEALYSAVAQLVPKAA
jgi:nucleoside 2-deoxyribosyltransferase